MQCVNSFLVIYQIENRQTEGLTLKCSFKRAFNITSGQYCSGFPVMDYYLAVYFTMKSAA